MEPPLLIARSAPATTTLTLNRPERRNALNIPLLEALTAAIDGAAADSTQRILLLRGAGPAFCAGLDLAEAADPDRAHRSAELVARSLQLLAESRLVTIAVVHGAAIAGGAGLMSACDFAVADAGTRIGYPEPRRGLVAGLVMTFLRRQLGERDAREILLSGELFSAERARTLGLINRIALPAEAPSPHPGNAPAAQPLGFPSAPVPTGPSPAALDEADRFAASVLAGGPRAVEATKKLLGNLWPRPLRADLDQALAFHLEARHSAEAREGAAAFLEKRSPRWS